VSLEDIGARVQISSYPGRQDFRDQNRRREIYDVHSNALFFASSSDPRRSNNYRASRVTLPFTLIASCTAILASTRDPHGSSTDLEGSFGIVQLLQDFRHYHQRVADFGRPLVQQSLTARGFFAQYDSIIKEFDQTREENHAVRHCNCWL